MRRTHFGQWIYFHYDLHRCPDNTGSDTNAATDAKSFTNADGNASTDAEAFANTGTKPEADAGANSKAFAGTCTNADAGP